MVSGKYKQIWQTFSYAMKKEYSKIKSEMREETLQLLTTVVVQRFVRDYYGQIYANKLDNLE